MSSQSSTPGPSGSKSVGSSSFMPKAIGSLAKKQDDVTRQGTQKLKFVPTLPARRKKNEGEVKLEDVPVGVTATSTSGRGRGNGRGRGTRGRGGGGPPARPPVEMIASGPFALGPSMGGTSARRAAPRSNFAPIVPLGPGNSSALGAGLTRTSAPSLKKDRDEGAGNIEVKDDEDRYSDPDEGVEIVDMDDVRRMDWMAPESLRKEKTNVKKEVKVKKETKSNLKGKTKVYDAMDEDEQTEQVDLANALDLSESEEEEEMEDLVDDFALQGREMEEDPDVRAEKLYFFQFPEPFPTFLSSHPRALEEAGTTEGDVKDKGEDSEQTKSKKVTFAEDVKAGSVSTPSTTPGPENGDQEDATIDGVIGRLEIYQSGAVKMRLGDGIVFDVIAATQPSFLQHAVHLDMKEKRLNVLGEVNRRFVVSPNIDTLLEKLDDADRQASLTKLKDNLTKMDTK